MSGTAVPRPGRLTSMPAEEVAAWRSVPLGYDGAWSPGALLATGGPAVPGSGWHRLHHEREVAPERFATAGRALLGWGLQLGAGLGVRAEDVPLRPGSVAVLGLGPLTAPVRVVAVRNEPHLVGFAYGTLPGHPEVGEEAFWIERRGDRLLGVVSALSRAGAWYIRLGGPAARGLQHLAARRYLGVLAAAS